MVTKKIFIIPLFFFILLFLQAEIKKRIILPTLSQTMQEKTFNLKSKYLKNFTLGQERFIVTLLWISTFIKSDLHRDKTKIFNDWLYLRFNAITTLDKKFYEAYLWGGQFLSVIKDNPLAAESIFKKGIQQFPNDLFLNFQRGINALGNLKNNKIAIKSFMNIRDQSNDQTYHFVNSILAKLLVKENALQKAFKITKSFWIRSKNKPLKKHYFKLMNDIQTKIDLKCLNNKIRKNCNDTDLFGKKYIFKKNKFYVEFN